MNMKYLKRFEKFDKELVDELIDKGWDNLSDTEKSYLNNPDEVELSINKPEIKIKQKIKSNTYIDNIDFYHLELKQISEEPDYLDVRYGKNEYTLIIMIDANGDGTLDKKVFNGSIIFSDGEYVQSEFDDAYEYMSDYAYELDQFFENAFYEINNKE